MTDDLFLRSLRRELELSARKHYEELTGKAVVETYGWDVMLEGSEKRDMYDHAPGVGYYSVDASRDVCVEGFKTAAEIKDVAISALEECRLQLALGPAEYDGQFFPSCVVIRDCQGIVAKYQNGAWLEPSLSHELRAQKEAMIEALENEASEDSRSDSFDSARRLMSQARALREELDLSKRRQAA